MGRPQLDKNYLATWTLPPLDTSRLKKVTCERKVDPVHRDMQCDGIFIHLAIRASGRMCNSSSFILVSASFT